RTLKQRSWRAFLNSQLTNILSYSKFCKAVSLMTLMCSLNMGLTSSCLACRLGRRNRQTERRVVLSTLQFSAPCQQYHHRHQFSHQYAPLKFDLLKTGFVNCLFCATVPVAITQKEPGERCQKILC